MLQFTVTKLLPHAFSPSNTSTVTTTLIQIYKKDRPPTSITLSTTNTVKRLQNPQLKTIILAQVNRQVTVQCCLISFSTFQTVTTKQVLFSNSRGFSTRGFITVIRPLISTSHKI